MPRLIQPACATPLYFDYAATTPILPEIWQAMQACATVDQTFGNPASAHWYGQAAQSLVATARQQVADLLSTDAKAITWTSGATEANNLAIKGAVSFYDIQHIVTSKIEHKSVVDTCEWLEKSGVKVTWLTPDQHGHIGAAQLQDVLEHAEPHVGLVSLMWTNNETGTINDIAGIAALCQQHKARLHVDATQAVGKQAIDLSTLPVDYLSFSAHKIYGPKGVGALYTRQTPRARLTAQIHGGGHERGLRSGTLPTQQIVGMGAACEHAQHTLADMPRLQDLKGRLWQQLAAEGDVFCNSHPEPEWASANILNISIAGVNGESLLFAMPELAVSSGSACTSASQAPSYVLRALGLSDTLAEASLRFSLGHYTTEHDVDQAVTLCRNAIRYLRTVGGYHAG